MKERHILFSTAMAEAIVDGRGTQTRRILKGLENCSKINRIRDSELESHLLIFGEGTADNNVFRIKMPYGQVGDRLWVKESFFAYGQWEQYKDKNGVLRKRFIDRTKSTGKEYLYNVSPIMKQLIDPTRDGEGWFLRPSIFMPREASRILLEVTKIRIERLQDITEADAIAEGIEKVEGLNNCWKVYGNNHCYTNDSRYAYKTLWQSINGLDSWEPNPYVWVIEFNDITRK